MSRHNRIVDSGIPEKVFACVLSLARRLKNERFTWDHRVEIEDLVQEGFLAYLEVAGKYDPTIGTTPEQYAKSRIWGAMVDSLRKQHLVGRPERGVTTPPIGSFVSVDRVEIGRDPTRQYERRILLHEVERWIAVLPKRERVIATAMREGKTGVEAAREIGVSQARVSQLYPEVMRVLKKRAGV